MMLRAIAVVLVWLVLPLSAWAVIETYEFSSPELEQRYRQLSFELRCPKCQNQNIADSNAPIAQDLRKLLYQQLEAGASNEEILEHMVARYGEFVLYRPRFEGATLVLWLAPLILLLAGVLIAVLTLRRREATPGSGATNMTDDDQQRLKKILGDSEQAS